VREECLLVVQVEIRSSRQSSGAGRGGVFASASSRSINIVGLGLRVNPPVLAAEAISKYGGYVHVVGPGRNTNKWKRWCSTKGVYRIVSPRMQRPACGRVIIIICNKSLYIIIYLKKTVRKSGFAYVIVCVGLSVSM